MSNTRCQLLNAPEDCQWLRETHLKARALPPFKSFLLEGNEDCPSRIAIFSKREPLVTCCALECFILDAEEGTYFPLSSTAPNLDAFNDSADINAAVAKLLEEQSGAACLGMVSPIPPEFTEYARRKARAIDCRKSGLIEEARTHESACEAIFSTIPAAWRW